MASLNKWIDKKIKDDDINYFEYDDFSNVEKVDRGAFGIVNKAYWKSCGITIALKFLAGNSSFNEDNMNKFLKEVIIHFLCQLCESYWLIILFYNTVKSYEES
jgi:hypothetical protein